MKAATVVAVARSAFAREAAYRREVWLRVLGQLVIVTIQVTIWRSLLNGTRSGTSLAEMTTYATVSTCISAAHPHQILRLLDRALRDGGVAYHLLRPLSYPWFLLGELLGNLLFHLVFTVLPTVVVASLCYGVAPPASGTDGLAFAAALFIALSIASLFGYLVALVSFWVLTTFALEWFFRGLTRVLSGAFVPFWFFPPALGTVAAALPFGYLNFVPAAIYLGRVPASELGATLGLGAVWVISLGFLASYLWRAALKRLVVHGG